VSEWLRKSATRLRVAVSSMPRSGRIAAVLLVGVVGAGAAWLALSNHEPEMVAIVDEPLAPENLVAARSILDAHGIENQAVSGRLFVSAESAERAGGLLRDEGLSGHRTLSDFDQLTRQSDIWSSEAQKHRLWQAGRMHLLGRLISEFPAVHSATVLFDPGAPRRLGRPGAAPTAAVNVRLNAGRKMTARLIVAIADQVARSFAGMKRSDVCIVDGTGRSYRAADQDAPVDYENLARRRELEAYYAEKVRSALHYIDDVIVVVNVDADGSASGCTGAAVSIPRSYFVALDRAERPESLLDDGGSAEARMQRQLAKIQVAVAKVIGAEDTAAVHVDWYDNAAAVSAAATGADDESSTPAWSGERVLAGGAAALALAMLGFVLLRRRRLAARRRKLQRPHLSQPAAAREHDGVNAAEADEPPEFLGNIDQKRLKSLIHDEHPQTVAAILAHLSPSKAAGVLDGLAAGRRVEVARRIEAMKRIDPRVLADVERSLSERLKRAGTGRVGVDGPGNLARILRHATGGPGQFARANELPPALAFEDIAKVPPGSLSEALEDLESNELAVALTTADEKLKLKVIESLSAAAAGRLREDMDRIGPVRLSEVEAAQQRVAAVVTGAGQGRYARQAAPQGGISA